jgi:hypothetical protein
VDGPVTSQLKTGWCDISRIIVRLYFFMLWTPLPFASFILCMLFLWLQPPYWEDQPSGGSPTFRGKPARVMAPSQVEIPEGMSVSEAQAKLAAAGLTPPLLCKPLWTDGREGSHGLAVLHDLGSLDQLLEGSVSSEFKAPLVVQQFVEHGGVLFKVSWGGVTAVGWAVGCGRGGA